MSTVESRSSVPIVAVGASGPVPGAGAVSSPSAWPISLLDCRPMTESAHEPDPTVVARLARPTDLVLVSAEQQWDVARRCSAGRVVVDTGIPGSASASELAGTVASMLTNRLPSWLHLSAAAPVLEWVSEMLGRQRWIGEGALIWSGWGGPSNELMASGPERWLLQDRGALDEAATGSVRIDAPIWGFAGDGGPATAATERSTVSGVHAMIDRLPARRSERLDRLADLWSDVVIDGLIALTYPVDAGPNALADVSIGADEILVDHRRLVTELLSATSGRVLTEDLAVRGPSSTDDGMTWATLVLRRLGP